MSRAFGGSFTALYVRTPAAEKMSDADKQRLQSHFALAEERGALISTVYGDNVPQQIAEFARISGVTKIVIGRSNVKRHHLWSKPALTEQLASLVPNLDIYIIPDNAAATPFKDRRSFAKYITPHPKDLLITGILLTAATLIGLLFVRLGFSEANIITVYILGVLLTSVLTRGYICGILGSVLSVLLFNYFFTEPLRNFRADDSGYLITFAIMLIATVLTSTLAAKMKDHAKLSAESAYRTKVLLDTNRLLQKAQDDSEMINITASQLMKLLSRDVIAYPEENGKLNKGYVYKVSPETDSEAFFTESEQQVADWVLANNRRAGSSTDIFPDAACLYLPVSINRKMYGVAGIRVDAKSPDPFENSVLLSMIGECALAIENYRNAKEKEQAAVLAKNEQLRANLLRSISHDLRTPLTSISGGAANLLTNYDKLDAETRTQIFTDIFDDSQWLISLVENLLSVTRLEEGRMNFNKSVQLVDEVVEEALNHVNRKRSEHTLNVQLSDEMLLAEMDPRLIIQVIINLVDNAIKYTQPGSEITVSASKADDKIYVSVADNGPGIPDALKPKVFDMFFTGEPAIADSRRSLGLGLPLCKSIIAAHGGEITLTDNTPQGSVFTFTLPAGEVNIDE